MPQASQTSREASVTTRIAAATHKSPTVLTTAPEWVQFMRRDLRLDSHERIRLSTVNPLSQTGASGAPDVCRPHASVVAATAPENEPRAISRPQVPVARRLNNPQHDRIN